MTVEKRAIRPLHAINKESALHLLKTIAFTHRHTSLKELSSFFLHEENRKERLEFLKYSCDISEIFYVATCNRVEFVFCTTHTLDKTFLRRFFRNFRLDWSDEEIDFAIRHAQVYEAEDAIRHLFRVASSLDSMVVGEREIITQVRKAYDACKNEGLTGDLLRLVVKGTITTAKQVYTETGIANNPVSVVSLAERKLREQKLRKNAHIVMVGAGETNTNFSKYLVKQGFSNYAIFNRSLTNAQKLATQLASSTVTATAHSLADLMTHQKGFDVLITATASSEPVITPEIFKALSSHSNTPGIIIDLSMPSAIHPDVRAEFKGQIIDLAELKSIAGRNLEERQKEFIAAEEVIEQNIRNFRQMHRTRDLELRMKDVPEKIREIKDKAINDIFAEEISALDDRSREVLSKVVDYMEKKCISVPMVMAKEIILESGRP